MNGLKDEMLKGGKRLFDFTKMSKNMGKCVMVSIAICLLMVAVKPSFSLAQLRPNGDISKTINLKVVPAQPPYVNVFLDMAPVNCPITPYIENGYTMVPIRALGESLGATIGWDSKNKVVTYSKGEVSLLVTIGTSTINTKDGKILSMPQPACLVNGTTMVPLRLFSEILGYDVAWDDNTRSVYISSPEEPVEIWGFYALGSLNYSSWQDLFGSNYPYTKSPCLAEDMKGIFAGWFFVQEDGTVTAEQNPTGFQKPSGWPSVILEAKRHDVEVYSMYFADHQHSNISAILEEQVLRGKLAKDISIMALEYDGVLIDFEGLGLDPSKADSDMRNFNAFLDELSGLLGDKPMGVAVHPLNSAYKGYDHEYIGQIADFIVLMAYGYEDMSIPTPTAPFDKVDEAVKMEIELVDPQKVILSIPAYGTLYVTAGDRTYLHSRPPAKDGDIKFSDNRVRQMNERGFVPQYLCNYLEWEDMQGRHQAFLEDGVSLKVRLNLTKRYGIKGAAIWRLGYITETVLAPVELVE